MTGSDATAQPSPAEQRQALVERRLRGLAGPVPIPRASRETPAVLSAGQARLWFLDALKPGGTEWVVPLVLRASGRLDRPALRQALRGLLARHEALRTAYVVDVGVPRQQVRDDLDLELEVTSEVAEVAVRDALNRPFDLAGGQLVRAVLASGGADDVLVLTAHHIACDGWSTDLLAADLAAGYAAARGTGPAPAAPRLQYLDWAVWSSGRPTDPAGLAHWRATLSDHRTLQLPTDRPRPVERDPAADRRITWVDTHLADRVRSRAREVGTTPFTVLLAALGLMLSRRSGQASVFVGTPVAGRPRAQLHEVVGYFANTVAVPLRPGCCLTVGDHLLVTRESVLAALAHDSVPFEELVTELVTERDLGRNPLVDVLFVLEGRDAGVVRTPDDSGPAEPVFVELPTTPTTIKCDLIVGVSDVGSGPMPVAFDYATALFDRRGVERLADDWLRCLEALVGPVDQRLDALTLTEPDEQRWLDSLAGASVVAPGANLHTLILDQARRTPDRVAIEDAGGTLTYAELVDRASRLAARLPVGEPGIVAVCLERGNGLLVALLGILAAGHAYLPLDPDHPLDRIAELLADVRPVAAVSLRRLRGRLPGRLAGLVLLEDLDVGGGSDVGPERWASSGPADLAYVLHTSGSTGRPKGVMVPHAGIVNRLAWMQDAYDLRPTDRVLQKTPVTFDVSVWELFWPLLVGARVVFAPPGLHLEPTRLADFSAEHAITHLHFVPSMLDVFCELTTTFPDSVREVFCSGEALRAATVRRLARRSGARVHNLYGPTEASVDVTAHTVGPDAIDPIPIGSAVANTEVLVLDAALRPTPPGVVGEVYLAGVQLARGYHDRPDLTADRFVPHPFRPGTRMYRTGDLGVVEQSGVIGYRGRSDDQLKIRGVRIEPGEVEVALTAQWGVSRACVVVAFDGRDEPMLVGYLRADPELDLDEVRTALADRLPPALVPSVLVRLNALPLSSSGKVDRRALQARPRPQRGDTADQLARLGPASLGPPADPVEELVLAAFADVLGTAPIKVDESFFGAGGDSMRAIRVVAWLRDRGFSLTVADLFRQPSARRLAPLLRTPDQTAPGRAAAVAEAVAAGALLDPADRARLPAGVVDGYPLSQIQAGMIFEMLGDPALSPYRNVTSYPVEDPVPFDQAAFGRAVASVVQRHDVLRTSVDLVGFTEPLQLVHAEPAVNVSVTDLRSDPEPYATIRASAARERSVPFDLDQAPLWRLRVHRVTDDEWWLTEVECHVIMDGWSHNLVLAEILATYRELREGVVVDRPPPSQRFADFVAAERTVVDDPAEADFWRGVWRGPSGPVLRPGWGEAARGYATVQHELGDRTEAIDALARRLELPRKTLVMAATVVALETHTGVAQPVLGLVSQSRAEEVGGDEVVGMFLNTLPFRPPAERSSWRTLLTGVLLNEVELMAHRRFPLTAMYRLGLPPRPRAIDVSFNYLDFYTLSGSGVALRGVLDESPNEFPLVITAVPGALQASVHLQQLSKDRAGELLRSVEAALCAMVADIDAPAVLGGVTSWASGPPAVTAGATERIPNQTPPSSDRLPLGFPAGVPGAVRQDDAPAARRAVADAWCRVLAGLDPADLDDDADFAVLGGHSLDAMRIAVQLQAGGWPVTPRDLMQVRTFGGVVAVARGSGRAETDDPAAANDPLVPLTRGGPGRPWVLIHPGGGSVHWYRELASALPEDRPVFALQHPAVGDPDQAELTIFELAERYADALRAHHVGPDVDLLGWCGGGPVTWELARRWQAGGGSVGVLLLDPALEGLAGEAANTDQVRLLRGCEALLEEGRRTGDAALWSRVVPLLRLVVDDERGHEYIPVEPDWAWLVPVRVWRQLAETRLAYTYPPLVAEVTLLLGDELVEGGHVSRGGVSLEQYLDLFSRRLGRSPSVQRVSGSHVGVLQPPHVGGLAGLLGRLTATGSAGQEPDQGCVDQLGTL